MLQVRVLHMPDLFKLPHRYRKNALQPGQHVRAPCPGWARRPADKPTQQCAYAKICPDVSDDSHKTCGIWSCAQMWQECFGTLLGYLHLLAHMYKYPKNVADGPPANEPKNVPRHADKPLAKMLPECLTLHLQHLLAHSHKYPRNALHPTDYIWFMEGKNLVKHEKKHGPSLQISLACNLPTFNTEMGES